MWAGSVWPMGWEWWATGGVCVCHEHWRSRAAASTSCPIA